MCWELRPSRQPLGAEICWDFKGPLPVRKPVRHGPLLEQRDNAPHIAERQGLAWDGREGLGMNWPRTPRSPGNRLTGTRMLA